MENRVRIGIDIGLIIFAVGVAFNAGAAWSSLDEVKEKQKTDEQDIHQLKQDEQPMIEKVARMEALLADIRDELRQQNEKHTP
jgi:cell division protein FtsB